jgi:hypothetical protein
MTFEEHYNKHLEDFKKSMKDRAVEKEKGKLNAGEEALLLIDGVVLRVLDTIKDSYNK